MQRSRTQENENKKTTQTGYYLSSIDNKRNGKTAAQIRKDKSSTYTFRCRHVLWEKSESKTNGRSRTQINHCEGHDETLEFEQSHAAASIARAVSCHIALRRA